MSAEVAKKIRADLKAAGYKTGGKYAQVSVRSPHWGSIRVTVKDPEADFDQIEKISEAHERIRRCEMSHEILSGGNTFVNVNWSDEARQAIAEPFLERAAAAFAEAVEKPSNIHTDIPGTKVSITEEHGMVQVWGEIRMMQQVWVNGSNFTALAFTIAQAAA